MLEVFLSLQVIHTAGEYLQSILLTVSVINEQHTVGAFRHSGTLRSSIGQHVSQLGLMGLPKENHGLDSCLSLNQLFERYEETCACSSCLNRQIIHLSIWAGDRIWLSLG